MRKYIDRRGKRYGKLRVVALSPNRLGKAKSVGWICECDCGNITEVSARHLSENGGTGSCGCSAVKHKGRFIDRQEPSKRSVYSAYRYNAKKAERLFDITFNEFVEITSKNCSYCGGKPQNRIKTKEAEPYIYNGIDRVDNSLGYIKENCVPCCGKCNLMKRGMTVVEFISHIKKIYKHEG